MQLSNVAGSSNPSDNSAATIGRVFRQTYRVEGLRGFFKGMLSPMLSSLPYNSLIFTTYEVARRIILAKNPNMSTETMSFMAGSISGG